MTTQKGPWTTAFSGGSDDENCEAEFGEEFGSEEEEEGEEFAAAGSETKPRTVNKSTMHGKGPVLAVGHQWEKSKREAAEQTNKKSAPKSGGFTLEQVAMVVAQAMSASKVSIAAPLKAPRELKITFSATSSLAALANEQAPHLKLLCSTPGLIERLGGNQVQIQALSLIDYNNKGPVTFRLNGDNLPGKKHDDHAMDTGFGMCELKARTSMSFTAPQLVYTGESSEFKINMMKQFPGVKIDNIGTDVERLGAILAGSVFVPATSVVMVGVNMELAKTKEAMAAKGEKYSGPEPILREFGGDATSYQMPESLARSAINLLQTMFAETEDTIDVREKLYFTVERAFVSKQALEKDKSAKASSLWLDPRELRQSLHSGHTIQNECEKTFDVSITVLAKY